ncbi:protein-disulfide reductase DsbD [Marinimicrobium sp. C2-29]|uniref:protein-disulfide reductase DsbD n=1 Tax=Marinimicrobium sp. C2-29 TaxID=3139825 RepID=UPI0031399BBD
MRFKQLGFGAFAVAAILLLVSRVGVASDFLPVEEAFKLKVTTEGQNLVARWDVAPGYYLYQERLDITPNEEGTELGPAQFPDNGAMIDDPTFGEQLVHYESASLIRSIVGAPADELELEVTWQGCASSGLCYPPQTKTVEVAAPNAPVGAAGTLQNKPGAADGESKVTRAELSGSSANGIAGLLQNAPWGWMLLTFFALGIGLTFTPCVLPMIPILSGIIVGQSTRPSTARAFALSLTYVLSMAATYALAGAAVGRFGAQANLQAWMQQPVVLGAFGVVFILLALSMFGLFQLQLPSGIRDRLDRFSQRQKGGHLAGVGVMGALSALIVSPCVSAPLAGALIYVSATGDATLGGLALFALGLGMGVPLLVIGTLGNRILPKAGNWMNIVKQTFGVMLLAVALWLVQRLLPTPLAMALWALLAIGVGLHLGALQRQTSGWARSLQALGMSAVLWGAFLLVGAAQGQGSLTQPLAGMTTPGGVASTESQADTHSFERIKTAEQLRTLLNSGEPVMLDFYADWCISCITMEEEIFSQPEVQELRTTIRFVQLDITEFDQEHQKILDKLGLVGPPAVLFFSAATGSGEAGYEKASEIREARLVGEVGYGEFMATIEQQVLPEVADTGRAQATAK